MNNKMPIKLFFSLLKFCPSFFMYRLQLKCFNLFWFLCIFQNSSLATYRFWYTVDLKCCKHNIELKLYHTSESARGLTKTRFMTSTSRVDNPVGLKLGQRLCISVHFSDDAESTGLENL